MEEKLLTEILTTLQKWGIPSLLLLVIFLFIQNPERAEKLSILVTRPFYILFKWFAKSHIANNISSHVSAFVNKDLLSFFDNSLSQKVKIKVTFIENKSDIILKKDTLILRLKEDNDQTKNILTAANLAIPNIICPLIRTNINKEINKAIDLTVLKKFAEKLGNHAKLLYKITFLDPELVENPEVNSLIEQLIRIDKKGFFISIFINELNYLGEGIFANSDRGNRTDEVINFLNFLLTIAEREIGEINNLSFQSQSFGVGIILLAKSETANRKGLTPYLQRLIKHFYEGSDSVYIVAFPKAWNFLKNLISAIGEDRRYSNINIYKFKNTQIANFGETKIALVRINKVFSDQSLEQHLQELSLSTGSMIRGFVTDLSIDNAVVSFSNLTGYIKKAECNWYSIMSCEDELKINHSYDFKIKKIDLAMGNIELTRRFETNDPWKTANIPKEGEIIEVVPKSNTEYYLNCLTKENIEVKLPVSEIIWGEVLPHNITEIIGKNIQVKVLLIQVNERLIRVSHRQLFTNPWEEIKKNFLPDTTIMGSVVAINPNYVNVEISPGIIGRVTKESFYAAGNEYSDFENNLLIGQKLEVVIQKVWIGKEKISLELKRNIKTR